LQLFLYLVPKVPDYLEMGGGEWRRLIQKLRLSYMPGEEGEKKRRGRDELAVPLSIEGKFFFQHASLRKGGKEKKEEGRDIVPSSPTRGGKKTISILPKSSCGSEPFHREGEREKRKELGDFKNFLALKSSGGQGGKRDSSLRRHEDRRRGSSSFIGLCRGEGRKEDSDETTAFSSWWGKGRGGSPLFAVGGKSVASGCLFQRVWKEGEKGGEGEGIGPE